MGIVFGKNKTNNVKVLTIRETQSLPAVKLPRKFGKADKSRLAIKTRSTSYQAALPGLPNLISSDDDVAGASRPPPSFTLPPLTRKPRSPEVVAELSSSNSDHYSSCVEDLTAHVTRLSFMKEILGHRLDELKKLEVPQSNLSSRDSRRFISSRDSYRKTFLKSRKRSKKNSCVSEESSISRFNICGSDEDTIFPSGDDSLSEMSQILIKDRTSKYNTRHKMSRRSTLFSGLRLNSSSDEGLQDTAIRQHINKSSMRSSHSRFRSSRSLKVAKTMNSFIKERSGGGSAWQQRTKSSKHNTDVRNKYDYDADSEFSSSDSDEVDELTYSRRFKTNPFINGMRQSCYQRQKTSLDLPTSSKLPSDLVNILPKYARSSYSTSSNLESSGTSQHLQQPHITSHSIPKKLPALRSNLQTDRTQFTVQNSNAKKVPRKQNDEFDELDSAVEMLKLLL